MNQTIERFNLHSWYSYQSKRNFVLYKTIEYFFSNLISVFEFYIIFQKNAFLPKKLKFQTAYFFQNSKIEKKTLYSFVDHKIPLLLIPISVL